MEIIGITGGIGSGKSVVSRILRCRGERVYDCDLEARRIMDTSTRLKEEISRCFGKRCINANGEIVRSELSQVVFADNEARNKLNSLVHGLVIADIERKSIIAGQEGAERLYIESAIMRTSGIDRLCSRIWVVEASEELRVERVKQRSGLGEEEIRARMRSQQCEFENLDCNRISRIINDNHESLLTQLQTLSDIAEKK